QISFVPGTDLVRLSVEDRHPERAVSLANLYAQHSLAFLQEFSSNLTQQTQGSLNDNLAAINKSLKLADEDLLTFQLPLGVLDFEKETSGYLEEHRNTQKKADNLRVQLETLNLHLLNLLQEVSEHHPAILAARQDLNEALLRCTEEHPRVRKLRA